MSIWEILLILIGFICGGYACSGLLKGKIYCKGGPYYRNNDPIMFWTSILVYFGWMLMIFVFLISIGWSPTKEIIEIPHP